MAVLRIPADPVTHSGLLDQSGRLVANTGNCGRDQNQTAIAANAISVQIARYALYLIHYRLNGQRRISF